MSSQFDFYGVIYYERQYPVYGLIHAVAWFGINRQNKTAASVLSTVFSFKKNMGFSIDCVGPKIVTFAE